MCDTFPESESENTMEKQFHGQASESLRLGLLLAVVGGFLEAYTFLSRGGVFANCETGNLVLLGLYLAQGQVSRAMTYLPPILAFFCGVLLTNSIRRRAAPHPRLHWRQVTVLFEAACLAAVAFIPYGRWEDIAVTALVSFACSIQVQSFRKVRGSAYTTTMCTGNLRSAADNLYAGLALHDAPALLRAGRYLSVVLVFVLGAVAGAFLTHALAEKAVLLCALPLLAAFGVMFLPTGEEAP